MIYKKPESCKNVELGNDIMVEVEKYMERNYDTHLESVQAIFNIGIEEMTDKIFSAEKTNVDNLLTDDEDETWRTLGFLFQYAVINYIEEFLEDERLYIYKGLKGGL